MPRKSDQQQYNDNVVDSYFETYHPILFRFRKLGQRVEAAIDRVENHTVTKLAVVALMGALALNPPESLREEVSEFNRDANMVAATGVEHAKGFAAFTVQKGLDIACGLGVDGACPPDQGPSSYLPVSPNNPDLIPVRPLSPAD